MHDAADSDLTWRLLQKCCENATIAQAAGGLFSDTASDGHPHVAGGVDVHHLEVAIKFNSLILDADLRVQGLFFVGTQDSNIMMKKSSWVT